MKVSFVKEGVSADVTDPGVAGSVAVEVAPVIDVQATPVDSIPASAALVPVPTAPVAVAPASPAPFYDDENIGFEDIILPRINIVQKVGELSNVFAGGEIILKMALPIYTPPIIKDGVIAKPGTEMLNLTVLGFRKKQFAEKIVGGNQGALCNTEEEVAKLGGTLDYAEHEAKVKAQIPSKLFQRLATALCLIECPAALKGTDAGNLEFAHECEGRKYALVLWSMKGTAYTNGAKRFFTARKLGHLKSGGYPSYSWSLGTKLEGYGTNFAYIPVLKEVNKPNPPAFLAFVKELLGMGQ